MEPAALKSSSAVRWMLVALVLVSAILRFVNLSAWSFNGDEMNTLRDSTAFTGFRSPKPLMFILNHFLIAPWLPLDEFGLRLLPAAFGILAVPVMFWTARSLFGPRAGLITATLVAFNPWHIYWSQFARYYSLVFLLCAAFPVLLYRGVVEQRPRLGTAGGVLAILGILAHPSTALILAGAGAWFVAGRGRLIHILPNRTVARVALLAVAATVGGILAYRIGNTMLEWYYLDHDWGFAGPALFFSYAGWLVPTLVVFAAGGVVWAWFEGDRRLAALLVLSIGTPLALLVAISFIVPVSTAYLFATAPMIILAAGRFIDRLGHMGGTPVQRTLVVAACLTGVLVAGAPRVVSHYFDGTRFDVRAAADYVERHASEGVPVLADQDEALGYYLPARTVSPFPRHPARAVGWPGALDEPAEVWLVVSIQRRAGFYDQDLGAAADWVRRSCEPKASFGTSRLDHKHNELQLFRCRFESASGETPGR